jgi:hypothetical protein
MANDIKHAVLFVPRTEAEYNRFVAMSINISDFR